MDGKAPGSKEREAAEKRVLAAGARLDAAMANAEHMIEVEERSAKLRRKRRKRRERL